MPAWALALLTTALPGLIQAFESGITSLIAELGPSHPATPALTSAQSAVASAKASIAQAAKAS